MTLADRATVFGPIGVGVGHVTLVLGMLSRLGYPLDSFAGAAPLQLTSLIGGMFLVAFGPVLLFARTRLVVPLGMGVVGFGVAIVVGFTTPIPAFATLGEHVLVVGSSPVGAYANGWYVWLLAYGLGGGCEYVVRTSVDGLVDPKVFSSGHLPLDRQRSVLFGCVVGFAHTVVIVALGIGHERALLSGWLLGWGLLGTMLLGTMPTLYLLRYRLLSPFVGFVSIILAVGVETLTTTGGTPINSYLLFWPVYLVLLLVLAIGEYALRWGHRTATAYRRRKPIG